MPSPLDDETFANGAKRVTLPPVATDHKGQAAMGSAIPWMKQLPRGEAALMLCTAPPLGPAARARTRGARAPRARAPPLAHCGPSPD